jgi:hypothetical protein
LLDEQESATRQSSNNEKWNDTGNSDLLVGQEKESRRASRQDEMNGTIHFG